MPILTHIDLFSGIGGFSLAGDWAGFQTVVFCEIDPYCQKILQRRFNGKVVTDTESGDGTIPIYADIRDLDGTKFRGATLLTGGFPCQPFSCAGKRKGKEDDRYLWPEMLRVIKESQPTWIVGENVAGIVKMALDQVCSDLENEDYTVQTIIIPAVGVNAPHKRDRCWICAHRNNDTRGQEYWDSVWEFIRECSEKSNEDNGETIPSDTNIRNGGPGTGTESNEKVELEHGTDNSSDRISKDAPNTKGEGRGLWRTGEKYTTQSEEGVSGCNDSITPNSEHPGFIGTEEQGEDTNLQPEVQTREKLCGPQLAGSVNAWKDGKGDGRSEDSNQGNVTDTSPRDTRQGSVPTQGSGEFFDKQRETESTGVISGQGDSNTLSTTGDKDIRGNEGITSGERNPENTNSNQQNKDKGIREGENSKPIRTDRQDEHNDTNTTGTRFEGQGFEPITSGGGGDCDSDWTNEEWRENWYEVATQLCGMDDGLCAELDGFKLSKSRHRVERLKGLGNAICPEVAYEILRLIAGIEVLDN